MGYVLSDDPSILEIMLEEEKQVIFTLPMVPKL
jgi:hypothetical protein